MHAIIGEEREREKKEEKNKKKPILAKYHMSTEASCRNIWPSLSLSLSLSFSLPT